MMTVNDSCVEFYELQASEKKRERRIESEREAEKHDQSNLKRSLKHDVYDTSMSVIQICTTINIIRMTAFQCPFEKYQLTKQTKKNGQTLMKRWLSQT